MSETKRGTAFLVKSLGAGLLIVVPVYLSVLLLLRAMKAVGGLVQPLAQLLPEWLPAEQVLSLLLVLVACVLIGVGVQTTIGRAVRHRIETSLLEKIPGYALFPSLTRQVAGTPEEQAWKPALAEIENALVPAFIIEEFDGGRFTVFVPAAPTPLSGSVYILTPERVHPLDVPFTDAIKSLSLGFRFKGTCRSNAKTESGMTQTARDDLNYLPRKSLRRNLITF